MFKLDLEKTEEPEDKLPASLDHIESKRIPGKKEKEKKKKRTSTSFTILKPSTVWITKKCGKFFKQSEYQITLLASSETCIKVKKQ